MRKIKKERLIKMNPETEHTIPPELSALPEHIRQQALKLIDATHKLINASLAAWKQARLTTPSSLTRAQYHKRSSSFATFSNWSKTTTWRWVMTPSWPIVRPAEQLWKSPRPSAIAACFYRERRGTRGNPTSSQIRQRKAARHDQGRSATRFLP